MPRLTSYGKNKDKAIQLLAWTSPEFFRRLRPPDFARVGI